MVAPGAIPPLSSAPPLSSIVRQMGWGPVTFTVDDTLSMVAQGILPEDASIELLNGSLVYRDRFDLKGGEVVAGIEHDYVVTALSKLATAVDNEQRHVRTQTTLVCGEKHAPIPDGMVLRGNLAAYRQRLAAAADALCVIEVADSSYERDRGEKLIAYAKANIPHYVIINLRNRTAEVFEQPNAAAGAYADPQVVTADQSFDLRVGEGERFSVPLSDLLP